MDTTQKLPTVLSLCTGYGGVERGLDLAGVEHRVIAHVEIEAFAIANLVAKMEKGELDAAPVWSNLKTLPVEPFRDRVDILTGGYPCQPFSAAGKRLGEEDPRHLWPYICDIIRAVRPVRCFFENVEGHISLGLREVISDLESLGYKVAWGIFSAREVGAPHQRKRVYIMAHSKREQDNAKRPLVESGWERLGRQAEATQRENGKTSTNSPYRCGIAPHELADSHNGQREFQNKEIRSRRNAAVDGSANLANTESQFSERSISERDRNGQSEEALGDRSDSEGASSMAYTDSSGLGQGNKEDARQSSEQSDSSGFRSGNVTNPNNERLEGRLQGGCTDTQGWQEQEIRCATQRSDWRSGDGHSLWPPEPRLGRVVDGCANRVDRIRLLGNGVVPQTAAKAWMVLSEELCN